VVAARARAGSIVLQRASFLTPGEQDVDSEVVHRKRHGRKRRHAVHNEHDFGVFFDHCGNLGQRVEHSGRGFVVDEGDGVESPMGQLLVDQFRQDRVAPFDLQGLGFFAAAFAHVEPFVGESAAHAVEDLFLYEVA
jgi:hypothetical protein